MVTKERGTNSLNIMIPAMVLFLAIFIMYFMMLWDNIQLAHEELHNGLQMAEAYVISERNVTSERNRLQIVLDDQDVQEDTTDLEPSITEIARKPIMDGSLNNLARNFKEQIVSNFHLQDNRPVSGAIRNLSHSKGVFIENLFVCERVTRLVYNKTTKMYERQFVGYIVYDFICDGNGNISAPTNAITGSGTQPYLHRITRGKDDYNDKDTLAGSTIYATISFKETGGPEDKRLKNPITNHMRSISDVRVTEVMDIALTIDDDR